MKTLLIVAAAALTVSISLGQLMLAVLFFTALHAWLVRKTAPAPTAFPVFWFFLPVLFFKALSIPFGVNPGESLSAFASEWIILALFVSWMLMDEERLPAVFLTLAIGGGLIGVYGFFEVFALGAHRAEAGFTHALTYGNVIAMLMVLSLASALKGIGRNRNERIIYWAATLACALGLLASGSRGPILFGFAGAILIIALSDWRRGMPVAVGLTLLGIAAVVFVPFLRERFADFFTGVYTRPDTSFGTRYVLWSTSLSLLKEYWLTGIGPGNFRAVVAPIVEPQGVLSVAHAHNSYIQAALLHGVFGLIALLVFLGRIVIDLARRAGFGNPYAFAGLGVALVYLMEGLSENNFTDSEVAMLFYFITGAVLGASRGFNAKTAGE